MAPITRSKTAILRGVGGPSATKAVEQAPSNPPPVGKVKTANVGTRKKKEPSAKVNESGSRKNVAKRLENRKKAGKITSVPSKADGRIGMKGFFPNGLPDTGNETFIPGLGRNTAKTSHNNPVPLANSAKYFKAFVSKDHEICGALTFEEAAMPTLDGDIHDIWDRARHDNWTFGDQQKDGSDWRMYERLTPALRLATLWLTRPEYQIFWHTILYGDFTFDEREQSWELVDDASNISTERSKDMEERLRDLAKKVLFRFEPLPSPSGVFAKSHATPIGNADKGYETILHEDFMKIPKPVGRPSQWDALDICGRLRFLFLLAVQLGGQLAEVLWMERCRRAHDGYDARHRFPLILGNVRYRSMSQAFEEVVLGGRVETVNHLPTLGKDGLALTHSMNIAGHTEWTTAGLELRGINDRFASEWWEKK